MNNLVLLSNEDMNNIPKNLLRKNLILRTDKSVLESLLDAEYDNVIITSNFARNYGEDASIKAFQLITASTSSKIIYLSLNPTIEGDSIVNWMRSIGINNIYQINWKTISIEEFESILSQNNLIEPQKERKVQQSEAELLLMKASLETLMRTEAPGYFESNKGKLIDLIQNQLRLISENDKLRKKKIELEDINKFLEDNKAITDVELKTKDLKISELQRDFKELRHDVLNKQVAVEEYNNLIKNNKLVLEPKIELDPLSPTVLYFKEYEDIGFDNFFESIVYLLSSVNKLYTKAVILERSSRDFFNPYSNKGYETVHDVINKKLTVEADKFVVYGNPTGLIEELCSPENRVEILIVLDKTGTENIMIDHNRLLPFYLGSYREKIQTVDIPDESWISPVEGMWKSISPLLDRRILDGHNQLVYQAHATNHKLCRYIEDILFGTGD